MSQQICLYYCGLIVEIQGVIRLIQDCIKKKNAENKAIIELLFTSFSPFLLAGAYSVRSCELDGKMDKGTVRCCPLFFRKEKRVAFSWESGIEEMQFQKGGRPGAVISPANGITATSPDMAKRSWSCESCSGSLQVQGLFFLGNRAYCMRRHPFALIRGT